MDPRQRRAMFARMALGRRRNGGRQTLRAPTAGSRIAGFAAGYGAMTALAIAPMLIAPRLGRLAKALGGPSMRKLVAAARTLEPGLRRNLSIQRVSTMLGPASAWNTRGQPSVLVKSVGEIAAASGFNPRARNVLGRGGAAISITRDFTSPGVVAHELGHTVGTSVGSRHLGAWIVRKPSIPRAVTGTFVKQAVISPLEEFRANVHGARIFKRAGGSYTRYAGTAIPSYSTYVFSSPLVQAGVGYGVGRAVSRRVRRKAVS